MMVIYHSPGTTAARLAAAIHLGLLPSDPPQDPRELSRALEMLADGAPGFPLPDGYDLACPASTEEVPEAGALKLAGEAEGLRVLTLSRKAPVEVIERSFGGMADIWGIDRKQVLLVAVPPGLLGAGDALGGLLCRAGAPEPARRLMLWAIRRSWRTAASAALKAKRKLVH